MGKLDGKVAIITGAASGIGEAGARLFAKEGAKVVVLDVVQKNIDATVKAIQAAGGVAMGSRTDVAKIAEVQAMVDATMRAYGRIDILWSNAGIVRAVGVPIEQISVETWHQVLAVDLDGFFHCVKCVIPIMKAQRKGAIVSTASIAGLVANVLGRAPYTASKGALIALTRLLALELAGFNIRVNCIAPGNVRTNLGVNSALYAQDDQPRGTENLFAPMEWTGSPRPTPVTDATRGAEPMELAHTALYLVSDEVGPLTGITIAHDGGRTTR